MAIHSSPPPAASPVITGAGARGRSGSSLIGSKRAPRSTNNPAAVPAKSSPPWAASALTCRAWVPPPRKASAARAPSFFTPSPGTAT